MCWPNVPSRLGAGLRQRSRARLWMPAIACLLLAVVAFVPAGAAATRSVHLRGTAYEFNNTKVLLGGATIRVAEFPRLRRRRGGTAATTSRSPTATVTPYITAAGYHTIYLQTFRTAGQDLRKSTSRPRPTTSTARWPPAQRAAGRQRAVARARSSPPSTRATCATSASGVHRLRRPRRGRGDRVRPPSAAARPTSTRRSSPTRPALSSVDGGVVWIGVPAGSTRSARRTRTRALRASSPPAHPAGS